MAIKGHSKKQKEGVNIKDNIENNIYVVALKSSECSTYTFVDGPFYTKKEALDCAMAECKTLSKKYSLICDCQEHFSKNSLSLYLYNSENEISSIPFTFKIISIPEEKQKLIKEGTARKINDKELKRKRERERYRKIFATLDL